MPVDDLVANYESGSPVSVKLPGVAELTACNLRYVRLHQVPASFPLYDDGYLPACKVLLMS